MAGMTAYLQKKLLDHFLGLATYTIPATLYLSLHTGLPTDSGSHLYEVPTIGTGYARQQITGIMSVTDLSSGVSTNTAVLNFGTALSDWGTMLAIGVEDAISGGNMLLWGVASTPKAILTGAPFQFSPSQINIRFE